MLYVLLASPIFSDERFYVYLVNSSNYGGATDTFIDEFAPTNSYATNHVLEVSYQSDGINVTENKQTLLRFDLSPIPTNAIIEKAIFHISTVSTQMDSNAVFMVSKVTSGWNQNITWSDGVPSHTPSGTTLSVTNLVATFYGLNLVENTAYQVGMENIVQSWVEDPTKNFGVLLHQVTGTGAHFFSGEANSDYYRPGLLLVYTVPTSNGDDELPDYWQTNFFGSPSAETAKVGSDSDGDGFTNIQEYTAGTSPVDRNDAPGIFSQRIVTESGIPYYRLQFFRFPQRSYIFEKSTDLKNWERFGAFFGSSLGFNEPKSVHDLDFQVDPNQPRQFFRLRIERGLSDLFPPF
jgi:hypothetical protein